MVEKLRGVVHLRSGKRLPVWLASGFKYGWDDFTEKTLHRFSKRGFMEAGFVFVQGDRVDYVEVEGV